MGSTRAIPMKRLQAADKLLGFFVCAALQPLRWLRRGPPPPRAPRRILCIKFWGIGSLQMLSPAARHLREQHPEARIELLTLSGNAAFARGLEQYDAIHTFDVEATPGPRGWIALTLRIGALVARLRSAHFDAVYDFEFFTRFSALVTLATGSRVTHGFAAPNVWRGSFHAHTVPFNRYWHVTRNFRALAGGEDGSDVVAGDLAPFHVARADEIAVETRLARAGIGAGRDFVVLNPNAGSLSLERRWPAPNFAALARALVREDGLPVVFVGAPNEVDYVREIVRAAGEQPHGHLVDLAGELSIGELAALLARAACVVTNDSGPMHVTAALGTPLVALFGPETPVMYGPLGTDAVALWRPPACSPCINVHDNKVANCIHGRPECLVGIEVDEVLAQTRATLADSILHPVRAFPRHRRVAARAHETPLVPRAEAGR
jgi:lipopolysaccharide heptosyltransferase II